MEGAPGKAAGERMSSPAPFRLGDWLIEPRLNLFDDTWRRRPRAAARGDRPGFGQRAADHSGRRTHRTLDSERALAVIKILNRLAQVFQAAIIVVTHDEEIIPRFKHIYTICDGTTDEEPGEGRPI